MTSNPNDAFDLPSRRVMLGALAAVPAASIPAIVSAASIEPDPIFALIETAKLARAKAKEAGAKSPVRPFRPMLK